MSTAAFQPIRIYTEKNIFEFIPFGHPFRPTDSALMFVRAGRISLKEQIHTIVLETDAMLLINKKYVYEILETDASFEMILMVYDQSLVDGSAHKIKELKVFKHLQSQLLRTYYFDRADIDVILKSIDNMGYYIQNRQVIEYTQEIVESYFNIIMYHLVSLVMLHNNRQRTEPSRAQQIVYDFIVEVSRHYLQERSLDFYREKLGLTARYLSRVIKEQTGKTPSDIIAEFILNEAKTQLSSTSLSVSEIAENLHFSDQYAFSHFFKRHLHQSPRQYKAQFK